LDSIAVFAGVFQAELGVEWLLVLIFLSYLRFPLIFLDFDTKFRLIREKKGGIELQSKCIKFIILITFPFEDDSNSFITWNDCFLLIEIHFNRVSRSSYAFGLWGLPRVLAPLDLGFHSIIGKPGWCID